MTYLTFPYLRHARACALAAGMALLGTAPVLAVEATQPATPAASPAVVVAGTQLPAAPSELLRASRETWAPVLAWAALQLDARAAQLASLPKSAQIEYHIHRTVLAQARQDWQGALEGVRQARQLQESTAGRHTAGLLNELLARQALANGDAAWLRRQVRDRVLEMPWADVESTVRTLREQLASVKEDAPLSFAKSRLDVSAAVTSNNVDLGFLMQLLGMRFQLLDVMPNRDAIVAGLDEVLSQRQAERP